MLFLESLIWRRSSRARFLCMSVVAALASCSSSAPSGGGDGDGDSMPGGMPSEVSIAFSPSSTLTLAPSESATLTARVVPQQRQDVTFELLTESESFDGFLVGSTARVREDGTVAVELQAPSSPATFMVRASLSHGPQAVRAVSVSSQGYGTVRVLPVYTGVRDIPQWTASARAGVTCDDIGSYFSDGPLIATGSSSATITDVPSGTLISVTVRGAQLASGCSTISTLGADDVEELMVTVKDRPIDVQTGTLSLALGVESVTAVFATHLEQAIFLGQTHFYGESESEGEALLNLMALRVEEEQRAEFDLAATEHSFAQAINNLYEGASPIASSIESILTEAADTISGDNVFLGDLTLGANSSQFLLTEAAGAQAALSGFFLGSTWMASAEPDDTVALGGALTYEPLRWLVAIAEQNAAESDAPSEQLVLAARCDEVALALEEAAMGPAYSGCDTSCLEDLCTAATLPLWEGLGSAGNGLTTLHIAMSGTASLDGRAEVQSIDGSWIGRLGAEETSIKGPARATRVAAE